MDIECKRCWNCSNFHAYYTRGFCCLVKEENGYCALHEKVMMRTDACEKWHCHYTSRQQRFNIALNATLQIYKTLSEIEQILQEEKELREFIGEAENING